MTLFYRMPPVWTILGGGSSDAAASTTIGGRSIIPEWCDVSGVWR